MDRRHFNSSTVACTLAIGSLLRTTQDPWGPKGSPISARSARLEPELT